jgi:RNA polymerase sigma-70 factor (ECF subfamily)
MTLGLEPDEQRNLSERVRSGDVSAEEELVKAFGPRLLRLVRLWARDEEAAREIVNDSLFTVVRALREDRVREPEHLAAFLCGTARNLTRTFQRSRARRPIHEELSPDAVLYDPREEMGESSRRALVRDEIARLAPVDQSILEMSLVGGFTLAEVGERLGLSHEAARARKSRALRRLAEAMRCHTSAPGGDQREDG